MIEHMLGFFAPWMIYGLILVLHLVLPARRVEGYVRDASGALLRYRLNGLWVFTACVALWAVLGWYEVVPWDWLWTHRWSSLAGAASLGLLFTLAIVLPAPPTGRGLFADLFFGRLENPQGFGGRVDAKMFLYLGGATLLELNVLAFTAGHLQAHASGPSPGVLLHAALLTWFLCDYLIFERVHLYTYDLFAERVGFKLGWGCLTFYAYFYAVGLWWTADLPNPNRSVFYYAVCATVFFVGWTLARGANLQKYSFKRAPARAFLGIEPRVLSDGAHTLLSSGFWGIARHVNYLGEILMAVGLAAALGWPWELGPWLYPLYYLVLLLPRERDDDRRCARKYGELWEAYRAKVPHRIVPGLY